MPAVRIAPELMEEPAEISVADVLTMRSDVPGVAYVTLGSGGTRGFPLVAVGEEAAPEDASVLVQSVTPDEFAFQGLEFVAGGPFTWDDFSAGEPRIVLDADSVAPRVARHGPGRLGRRKPRCRLRLGRGRLGGTVADHRRREAK